MAPYSVSVKMEIKNLKYNENGTINMDIKHPLYGWVPFTADPNDVEEYGRLIFKKAQSGEYGKVAIA